jgi:CheY-like chemotaxis protein
MTRGALPTSSSEGSSVRSELYAPILIVDDSSTKRMALRSVLEPLGYPIFEAGSGRDALRCVLAQDFAVILLDYGWL